MLNIQKICAASKNIFLVLSLALKNFSENNKYLLIKLMILVGKIHKCFYII